MAVKFSPIGNDAPFLDSSGNPLSGGLLYTYTAGSSTPENTYTTSAGSVANANPIVLDSGGYPATGGSVVSIWLTVGVAYKFVLKTAALVTVWARDNVSGINDATVTLDQWVSGPAPTYISATSFSLVGDQTSTFQVGRRLKTTNSGGTIYSYISASTFGSVTTVTVVNDSGTLDSGLSAVSYGLLSATNPSYPGAKKQTRTVLTSGTAATYTTPLAATRLQVRVVGGGGGGGGSAASGSAGTASSFNSIGANPGAAGSGLGANSGGAGGSGGAGSASFRIAGSQGAPGSEVTGGVSGNNIGGIGGGTAFAGSGRAGNGAAPTGGNAGTNSGAGGGGAGGSTAVGNGGGGGGEYIELVIPAPAATYIYTVGGGGAGAVGGSTGGNGAAGIIIIDEYYG